MGECEENTINEIISNVPNAEEMKQVIANRESQQKFVNDKLFRQGSTQIGEELIKIKAAILSKDGIVSTEKQDLFREQLERTFNTELIQSMSSSAPKRRATIREINKGVVEVEEEEEEDDTIASSDAGADSV